MILLEILIPTYNRPLEITKCLDSVFDSLSLLPKKVRLKVGITIRNNSTKNLDKYQDIEIEKVTAFNLTFFGSWTWVGRVYCSYGTSLDA